MEEWKADPKRGAKHVEPRRQEVVEMLKISADVAYFHIDEDLEHQINALKKKAGEQKQKISRAVADARSKPAMQIVRKYWDDDPETMWKHFVHNMTT